jgi:hypothetical protein
MIVCIKVLESQVGLVENPENRTKPRTKENPEKTNKLK